MITPLLSTKLHVPRYQRLALRTSLVPRPHLLKLLDAGLDCKLTLIAAPAGFGKSTLLAEWISAQESASSSSIAAESTKQTRRPVFCWLSLEESDNDPVRFWLYFIAALQSKLPDFHTDAPALLLSPEPPPPETVLSTLINDLVAWTAAGAPAMAPEIVLILEDYHTITVSTIHQNLVFLLDHFPPALHLVMTTRADPPLPLARLRTRGQLLEIRADELRFSAAETVVYLNERMGLDLASDQVQLLAERTEGWIVGLQLAALSMRGQEDKSGFLRSFSGSQRYVLNYLTEEVFRLQPQTVQDFLLCTCILTRLSGPLCDALVDAGTGIGLGEASQDSHTKGQVMLEQLEQANLFLISLDDQGQWYRYHQLFAEVIQYRLRREHPEMAPLLHRRAGEWFAEQGYMTDAIHHALLGSDFSGAAALIEQVWPTLWNQGAIATLFNWMEALPTGTDQREYHDGNPAMRPLVGTVWGFPPGFTDTKPGEALWGRPNLYMSYAWGLALTGQIEAAETTMAQVESALERTGDEAAESPATRTLLGRAAALRAMLAARRGNTTDAVLRAKQALALIPVEAASHGDALYTLGLARQQEGALAEALHAYTAAAESGETSRDNFLAVAAQYHAGRVLAAQGHLRKAAAAYQQTLAMAAQSGKQLPVVGLAHIGFGEILYQWNDVAAAVCQVDLGLALNPRRDLTYTDGPLHRFSILARIRHALGDRERALAAVELAKDTARQTGIAVDIERAAALEALIRLRIGEEAPAIQWAERYAHTRTDAERLSYLREFETLVYVRVLLAQNRGPDALALLTQWLPMVEAAQRWGSALEIRLLQVLALRLDGQPDVAAPLLARCFMLAEPEGYVRLFLDEGASMHRAVTDVVSWLGMAPTTEVHAGIVPFANRLLGAFAGAEAAPDESGATAASPRPQATSTNLIDPLTARELEVLHLLAAGLSNAAIAEQLIVSVGTVKTHLKHIYHKLAVQSRTQAVAQARMFGLLRDDSPF